MAAHGAWHRGIRTLKIASSDSKVLPVDRLLSQ